MPVLPRCQLFSSQNKKGVCPASSCLRHGSHGQPSQVELHLCAVSHGPFVHPLIYRYTSFLRPESESQIKRAKSPTALPPLSLSFLHLFPCLSCPLPSYQKVFSPHQFSETFAEFITRKLPYLDPKGYNCLSVGILGARIDAVTRAPSPFLAMWVTIREARGR